MIKNYNTRKLGKTSAHRSAMLKNLVTALFLNEKITTTLAKAKELARYSDRLITNAKANDLNAKKKLASQLANKEALRKVREVLVPRYSSRQGGFAKIYKMGLRQGDRAEMAVIKLIS